MLAANCLLLSLAFCIFVSGGSVGEPRICATLGLSDCGIVQKRREDAIHLGSVTDKIPQREYNFELSAIYYVFLCAGWNRLDRGRFLCWQQESIQNKSGEASDWVKMCGLLYCPDSCPWGGSRPTTRPTGMNSHWPGSRIRPSLLLVP